MIVGAGVALMNGVPMRLGAVDNDGWNAISIHKSKTARYAFWFQMKVNESQAEGIRIKNMPEEWFFVPSDEEMQNSITAAAAVIYENRLMDEHKFGEVLPMTGKLCFDATATVGLY